MSSCSTLDDSTYSSTSEGEEPDSDREEIEDGRRDQEDDPDKLLGTWLGQLQQMERGLEGLPAGHKLLSSNKLTIPTPRMDTYRFSMANMEDSQDIELDAILGELCALEDKLDREIMPKSQSANQALGNAWNGSSRTNYQSQNKNQQQPVVVETKFTSGHSRSNSGGGGTRPKFEIGGLQVDMDCDDFLRGQKMDLRTESPDNDSAFSDNVSMLSSESSASSGGVRGEGSHSSRSMSSQSSSMSLASSPTQVEQAARLKAEKIKIALEKMKEASIKKLFIKAFSADNSAKSLLIDERMTVGHVCKLLAEKNHVSMDPKWALVEQIPELYIERVYEDHEHVVENLLLWTRDSCNRLFFLEKSSKYDLFMNPQIYLLGGTSSEKHAEYDDDAKSVLLDEFFSTSNVGVPEVEGPLYLKSDGKKAWKKHFFVLRASGLYYCPKGKSKLSKDLLCLTTFDMNHVYVGLGWKKKYKAPTEFGFAIKHPQIQTKSSKYIKYLCAEDEISLKQWVMGIRIAKYGMQLKENYDNLLRDIAEEDLENLANARSFSVSSVAKTSHSDDQTKAQENALKAFEKDMYLDQMDDEPPTTLEKLHKLRVISRQDSIKSSKSNASSSSGCPSERSSTGTPTTDHLVFETDFPMGTIKRKPSMTPKIPLTTTTRNLAKQSGEEGPHLDGTSIGSGSGGSCNGSLSGSLGRSTCGRFSLRRSYTDERILLGSLTRRRQNLQGTPTPPSTLLRDDFPLPPPPPDICNMSECMNFDTLPPPPPEAFRNATLNLDALPPPPVLPDDNNDVSWLNESNISALPPPPSLQNSTLEKLSTPEKNCKKSNKTSPAVPPKPRKGVRRRQSESDARATPPRLSEHKNGLVVIKPKPSKQNLNLELSNCAEPSKNSNKYASPDRTSCADNKKAANSRSRRTSAPCDASNQLQVHTVISPGTTTPVSPKPSACNRKSRSQRKPSPPKRNENTKLSSAFTAPQRRSASASAAPYDPDGYPPESFLRNLQKVMVRKWKVAQQLSTDNNMTSHQIFGFRDPNCLPTAEETYTLQRSPSSPPPVPTHGEKYPVSRSVSQSQTEHSNLESSKTYAVNPKKHPPPPPPKKSDNNKATLW